MKDKKTTICIILASVAICISVAALVMCISLRKPDREDTFGEDVQYVLYLGTNDKDTDEPVYTPEESKRILKEILLRHMGEYTIQEAEGGWVSENGTEYQEYTLVILLSDTTLDKVHALCDELIDKFDQDAVLINMNKDSTEFYYGSGLQQ